MNRVELISKGQKLLDIKDLQVLQKEYEQWIDDLRQSEDFGKTMERNSILLHISSKAIRSKISSHRSAHR